MIEARNLSVLIDGHRVLEDVSLVCPQGSFVALIGPSGSGKTTLLGCLGLLQAPSHGEVLVDGEVTNRWKLRERLAYWRQKAAFVYQDSGIIDYETVAYNVALNSGRTQRGAIDAVLARVGLEGRGKERGSVLSGGEKQRLGIARALYKDARDVFVDEPTASLDASNRETVVELLMEAVRKGATVVAATHDESLAARADVVHELKVPASAGSGRPVGDVSRRSGHRAKRA